MIGKLQILTNEEYEQSEALGIDLEPTIADFHFRASDVTSCHLVEAKGTQYINIVLAGEAYSLLYEDAIYSGITREISKG